MSRIIVSAILVSVFLVGITSAVYAGGCGGCGMSMASHEGHNMNDMGDNQDHSKMNMSGDGNKEMKSDTSPTGMNGANTYILANGKMRFVDPISGVHNYVTETTPYHEMSGKRYYLTKSSEMEEFMGDMDKYTKTMIIPANIVEVDGENATIKCPVTKEKAPLSSKLKFADYNGKRYYFCCTDCKEPFLKNPSKYVK